MNKINPELYYFKYFDIMAARNNSIRIDFPLLFFETSEAWMKWLEKNHSDSPGVWLRFYKKSSGVRSINYDLALDEALCFGWIDGQIKSHDEQSYLQKFTPRRIRSVWSKRNIENVLRLGQEGRMKTSGIREVEAAKADGRWNIAYDSPANMSIPDDLMEALSKDSKSADFFNNLNRANKYSITFRLQTAKKTETREKRMKAILEMLSKGRKFH
jgi:uncharacterized protein YdeI (YjbR/CyaY-like superfamily)